MDAEALLQRLEGLREEALGALVKAVVDVSGCSRRRAREVVEGSSLKHLPEADDDAGVNFDYGQFLAFQEVERLLRAAMAPPVAEEAVSADCRHMVATIHTGFCPQCSFFDEAGLRELLLEWMARDEHLATVPKENVVVHLQQPVLVPSEPEEE